MTRPLVSINIIVWNIEAWGVTYLEPCLRSIKNQTYDNIEVTIVDNNSNDNTVALIKKTLEDLHLDARIFKHTSNPGVWVGQEIAFGLTKGKYILGLSLDTVLDKDFVTHAVDTAEHDENIGAIQAKVYSYDSYEIQDTKYKILDTVGFQLFKSNKIINEGHGQLDQGQYNEQKDIFGVEGAVPFFRRSALDSIRIDDHFADPDYYWYGDDFDMAWRMTLYGWRQVYVPDVIARHDRQTTKSNAKGLLDVFRRIRMRKQIPVQKRRWDLSNTRFTIIKNQYIINSLLHFPRIFVRECMVLLYTILIEPMVLPAYIHLIESVPTMLKRRRIVMRGAKRTAREMRRFYS